MIRGFLRIMQRFVKILTKCVLIMMFSCIDPYAPDLKNYTSLLVVEGLITNENRSYEIKLSRTYGRADSVPEMVSDANLYITDNNMTRTDLQNCGNGIYKTDSTLFTGQIGQKYTLHIATADGNEYVSNECPMLPVPDIDRLYYEKSDRILGNPGWPYTGLKIMLSTGGITEARQYLRWTSEEVWKILIPYPPSETYICVREDSCYSVPTPDTPANCWKRELSTSTVLNSISPDQNNANLIQEIQFIAPSLSDKLSYQYSILVKQYSLSEPEYNFWNMFRQVQESTGDFFGFQPYPNTSNIHNVNIKGEPALGYFEVSAVARKRIYITSDELSYLNMPVYDPDCRYVALSPSDWPPPPPTFEEIYYSWVYVQHYTFIRSEGGKYIFAKPACAMCEPFGFSKKPEFWIDPE
jgi:hypothetical protein